MKLLQKIILSLMFASMLNTAQGTITLRIFGTTGGFGEARVDEKTSTLGERTMIKHAVKLNEKVYICIPNNMSPFARGPQITDFSQTIGQLIALYPTANQNGTVSFAIQSNAPEITLEFKWDPSIKVSGANVWTDEHGNKWSQVSRPDNTPLNLLMNESILAAFKDPNKEIYLLLPDKKTRSTKITDFSQTIADVMKKNPKAVADSNWLRFEVVDVKKQHEKEKHEPKK